MTKERTAACGAAIFILPVEVVSEMNRRDHWAKRYRRAKNQKQIAFTLTRSHARLFWDRMMNEDRLRLIVTMTRIMRRRQRPFDSDNLAAAFKAVRDGVAKALGIDDGCNQVDWRYGQERNGGGWSGIRIAIAENTGNASGDGEAHF